MTHKTIQSFFPLRYTSDLTEIKSTIFLFHFDNIWTINLNSFFIIMVIKFHEFFKNFAFHLGIKK